MISDLHTILWRIVLVQRHTRELDILSAALKFRTMYLIIWGIRMQVGVLSFTDLSCSLLWLVLSYCFVWLAIKIFGSTTLTAQKGLKSAGIKHELEPLGPFFGWYKTFLHHPMFVLSANWNMGRYLKQACLDYSFLELYNANFLLG